MKLGEAVAISVLTDFNATYNENFGGFSLTKFDGTVITLDDNSRRPHSDNFLTALSQAQERIRNKRK
jgi:hypothetical protein